MGIDVGLVGDGTAVAITYAVGEKIVLAYHEIWYAGVDWRTSNPHLEEPLTDYARQLQDVERLDFDEIAAWIIALTKRFHITDGLFDRWNGIPLEQALHKRGLTQFQSDFFTRDQSSKMFQAAKMLMFDERLVLYDYPIPSEGVKHSPLIKELQDLQAQQMSRNLVIVEAPKIMGAHDDQSDALIRAIWLTHERLVNHKFTAHGGAAGAYHPHTVPSMSTRSYQSSRMRTHGAVIDRNVRLGRMMGRIR
jgi:hypothetical protein